MSIRVYHEMPNLVNAGEAGTKVAIILQLYCIVSWDKDGRTEVLVDGVTWSGIR